jgi:single-stranded-DNA-specific exonuclease
MEHPLPNQSPEGSSLFDGKLSTRNHRWNLLDASSRDVTYLKQRHNLPDLIARLLAQRNVSVDEAPGFLSPTLKDLMPDPFHLKDMEKAVQRTLQAIEQKQNIVIFGDYDVDGATASAVIKRFFDDLGAPSSIYIPDRALEGYGINQQALETLKAEGYCLVITVDCGTTSFDALTWATANAMDVIVLDHHMSEETLPPAYALVNPNRRDETSPYTYLCAAGLAFLFVAAIQKRLKETGFTQQLPDLRGYLDLVALGTVCDMVPLVGLNRAYVKQGLKVLHKQTNTGLKTLMQIAEVAERPSAYHLGFLLGPRINAGGRIGQSNLGATLLSTKDTYHAQTIAETLHQLNKERQLMEAQMIEEAMAQVEDNNLHQQSVICVASNTWHMGIVGIVAGRIKERYNKPCFVIAIDEQGVGKGSGRSVAGVNLGALAHTARSAGILVNGGGHAMAAGITVDASKIDTFREFLFDNISSKTESDILDVHGSLTISGASLDLIDSMEQLAPFGSSNPTPLFVIPHVRIAYANVVGTNHVKCTLESEDGKKLAAMAFQALETEVGQCLLSGERRGLYHVVGTLNANQWQGRVTPQFIIKDIMET